MPTNELMHHGIKGQKWGVRRRFCARGSPLVPGRSHREIFCPLERWTRSSGAPGFRQSVRPFRPGARIAPQRASKAAWTAWARTWARSPWK